MKKCDISSIALVGKLNTWIKSINSFMTESLSYRNQFIETMHYLNHAKGCNCCVSRILASKFSMRKHAYGGTDLVPIAVPETCCLTLILNSEKLLFNSLNAKVPII